MASLELVGTAGWNAAKRPAGMCYMEGRWKQADVGKLRFFQSYCLMLPIRLCCGKTVFATMFPWTRVTSSDIE